MEKTENSIKSVYESEPEMKWYIVHTFTGSEHQVKTSLEEKISILGLENFFGRIIVPMENIVEMKKGKKKNSKRRYYPGYILIEMIMNEETWYTVRDIPKVTGFIGGNVIMPTPMANEEAEGIIRRVEDGLTRPSPKYSFEQGEEVRIIDGPFSNFKGTIGEVNTDKETLRVLIPVFGRSTPVELNFIQVNKV